MLIVFFSFDRPVVYKNNFVWNSNDTVTYSTGQKYYFDPELSEGDPYTDVITTPNVVLIVSSEFSRNFR